MGKNEYIAEEYDVAVIGAGHAGLEAAFAAARLGVKTALFTLSLDLVGNMPCNPSIGGTAKGHLVYEIDALGGEMGKAADAVMLQSRMLNLSKGAAVQSLRMQADRRAYQLYMKKVAERTENLDLIQCEITRIIFDGNTAVAVVSANGGVFPAKKVIIATGTHLGGRVIVGEHSRESGPDNSAAATELTKNLEKSGIKTVRFKTGTPPRVHADSIDFSKTEVQPGDEPAILFSSDEYGVNTKVCHITYTTAKTKEIILKNLSRSPLFSGEIKGTGPRYCPSIEDKIVRFPDKERHQVFIEPMGADTDEMYLQGLSSSMPEEVQRQIVHSVPGLEHAKFMRTAYAIEYDCIDPSTLKPTLEFKDRPSLYGAGQFNGSSGYEEAAAQGLIAGINAALAVKGEGEFTLDRSESYIGTLIDDLVTKGTNEPYRMMTSRTEYRLLLRQDNAAARLMPKARKIGLIGDEKWNKFIKDEEKVKAEIERLKSETAHLSQSLCELLMSKGFEKPEAGMKKAELLRRPGVKIEDVYALEGRKEYNRRVAFRAETEIKYEGYIKKQLAAVERFKTRENKKIPPDLDYKQIKGLRIEASMKLEKQRPENIGRASRISGVSPADISVLLIYLAERYPDFAEKKRSGEEEK